jgi:hypothetical protein
MMTKLFKDSCTVFNVDCTRGTNPTLQQSTPSTIWTTFTASSIAPFLTSTTVWTRCRRSPGPWYNMLTTDIVATAWSSITTTVETDNFNVNLTTMIDCCCCYCQWNCHCCGLPTFLRCVFLGDGNCQQSI